MTVVNTHLATGHAGACVIDLRTHRLASASRNGRARDGWDAEGRPAAPQAGADDLAQAIDRLLDRVGACLAAVPADDGSSGGRRGLSR